MNVIAEQMKQPVHQPLYHQIQALITKSLIGGEWRPGEAIPSEMDLAVRYQVSQGTVRKAIDHLAAENILIRKQGKGTFVATHQQEEIKRRFLRLTAENGEKEMLKNQFLSCEKSKAKANHAASLNLEIDAPTISIKRLMTFSGRPLIYDQIVVSASVFKGLNKQKVEESHGSMYSMYETEFGLRMVRANEQIKAVAADEHVAELLGLNLGTPLLSIERTSYTYGNQPMEWRLGFCLTDNHHYMSELE